MASGGLGLEGNALGEQLEEDHAECIEIAACVALPLQSCSGAIVLGCPHQRASRGCHPADHRRDAEVADDGLSRLVSRILDGEIAMDGASLWA